MSGQMNAVCGYREIPFEDKANHAKRDLLVWYPVDSKIKGVSSKNPWDIFKIAMDAPPASLKTKMPIVVLSHGYSGNPHQLSWLIRKLVHEGFIVLGIHHLDMVDGKVHINHWKRPRDISAIIDQFAASYMKEIADFNQIGIAGFSLGGTTAIWTIGGRATKLDQVVPGPEYAAGDDFGGVDQALPTLNKPMMAKDWRDPRIKAAFIMAPAWAWLFDSTNLRKISVPTYFIAGAADTVVVPENNAGYFARIIPGAIHETIQGKAAHNIFISSLNAKQRQAADPMHQIDFLFEDDHSINRSQIQSEVSEKAVHFFRSVFGKVKK